MTILWFNYEDMQKMNFKQKNLFTFTVAPNFQQINKVSGMTIPWINYETMKKIIFKQKNVFTFSIIPNLQHINEESTVNNDDLGKTCKRKKRYKLLKKHNRFRESTQNNGDICKQNTNSGHVDVVEIDDLGEAFKKKKRSKINKKCNLRRMNISSETYMIGKEHADITYDDDNKIDRTNELNKHTRERLKTIKIPLATFGRIHQSLYPPVFIDTMSAVDTDLDHQIDGASVQEQMPQSEQNPKEEDMPEKDASVDNLVGEIKNTLETEETNHANGLNKHTRERLKTIKIPFTTFLKIRHSLYPPVFSSANSANTIESDHQIDGALEQEQMPQAEQNPKEEDMPEKDATKDNLVNGIKESLETNHINELNKPTGVRSKTIKIPISTFAEIDNFLNPPLFGSTIQNTFKFINTSNKQIPQLDTKLFDTITYYHEEPYCHLVGFKSHEIIFSTELDHVNHANRKEKKDYYQSTVVPTHDSLSMKTREINSNLCSSHEAINIRVPVVVGEYNIEICLEEDVLFEEKIYKVKEISKKVILTNSKFVPASFAHSTADGVRKALGGKLFIEGHIYQNIEYIIGNNLDGKSTSKELEAFYHPLSQRIVLDIMIQLLQVQKVTMAINQQENLDTYALRQLDEQEMIILNKPLDNL